MIIINNLLWQLDTLPEFPSPNFNPFKDENGLFEAILLDIYYMPLLKNILLLFDFRSSLSAEPTENTGVLICEKVSSINISETKLFGLWTIAISKIDVNSQGILEVKLSDWANLIMTIKAKKATLLYGYVDGIGEIAANIEMDNLKLFLDTIPRLNSQITINRKSTLSAEN